jgi:hypothetical protein
MRVRMVGSLTAVVAALIVTIHVANTLVPAVEHDESTYMNLAATLATQGEYGNTWQYGHLSAPDRWANTGPPLIFPVALLWKAGLRQVVAIRLLTVTPYFLGFLVLFYRLLTPFSPEARLLALLLFLGVPGWGTFSSKILGEFPALFFLLAGAHLLLRDRWLPAGLLCGLAAIAKLSFLPASILGALLWCVTGGRSWRPLPRFLAGLMIPPLAFAGWLWSRYGATSDFAVASQGWIVYFHPRNFPLNLDSLNRFLPVALVVLAFVSGWRLRRSLPVAHLCCCLATFWILWHLAGFRGWLRYVLPALLLLVPPLAAGLADLARAHFPVSLKAPFAVAAAAFVFLGLYDNTYSIWTWYKYYKEQQVVARYLTAHPDRRVLGEGGSYPFPEYQWITGRKFGDLRNTPPQPGDIAMVGSQNRFIERESAAQTLGAWSLALSTPSFEMYERR